MKKVTLLFALLCVSTLIFAQTETQTATLKHGDNITAYYGNNAFVNAHEAAVDGDIITLSSGSFVPTTITKAITLRGAGCMEDPELLTLPTSITGEIHARIGGENRHLTIEGIIFPDDFIYDSLYAPTFIRCSFENLGYRQASNYIMTEAHFINCRIHDSWWGSADYTTFDNCIIWNVNNMNGENTTYMTFTANNCYIYTNSHIWRGNCNNCILVSCGNGWGWIGKFSVVNNCIGILNGADFLYSEMTPNHSWTYDTFAEVFNFFNNEDFDWKTEEMTIRGDIAVLNPGSDGTEVGIYGGTMPYAARPTYMVPNKTSADHQTTPDGKLNVHIDVIFENK